MKRSTVILLVLGLAEAAAAQDRCFVVPGTGERSQHVVGLHQAVRLSASCEFALAPGGPWIAAGALAARDTDFLEAFHHAASQPSARAGGDPRVLLGRPARRAGGDAGQQSLMLRYCAHYILEEQLGFEVVPMSGGGSLRIRRRSADECGGGQIELRAVQGVRPEGIYAGAAAHTLRTSARELELPQGDWSVYAARPGSAVGLRVGVFRSQRVVTPLASHLRSVGLEPTEGRARPLLAARWDPSAPGLLFHPTDAALGQELLWPELRTAADAGFLWLADTDLPGADVPHVIAPVQLESGQLGAVRLPDAPVREHMRATYGAAGDALAPTESDWRSIFGGLALCLTPSYRDARPVAIGAAVPDPGACASLSGLTVLAQQAQAVAQARFCIQRGVQVMSARGARHLAGENPECFALPAPGSSERAPYHVAVTGDRVRIEGSGLCVLLDNRPLVPGEGGEIVLDRSGLLEVRQGGGEDCTSRQALARLRLPVIDPGRDWHPIGLYTGATEEQMRCVEGAGVCPWRALAHDESEVFAFVEPRHELAFRLSTSPQVAAALASEGPVQLTQEVPVLAGVRGQLEGAREAAIVAYVSRDPACPNAEGVTYADLRARPPLDVDDLGPDAEFHALLLAVDRPDRPVQCLARATFRVRPSRAIGTLTVEELLGLELGLLGDTQLVLFANTPVAMGFALPLVWFRLTPGQRWISFDVAGNLVLAAAFPGSTQNSAGAPVPYDAQLSRLGVSLSWALTFGVPDYVPRLLSIGGMLHGAAETHTIENPIVSFFVGLNLATLIDLAGGR